LFVLIEENNHKIYWCSPFSFNAKKAISSPDSIIKPNSIAIIQDFGFYLASLKGWLNDKISSNKFFNKVFVC
jgi:hypothetical protein